VVIYILYKDKYFDMNKAWGLKVEEKSKVQRSNKGEMEWGMSANIDTKVESQRKCITIKVVKDHKKVNVQRKVGFIKREYNNQFSSRNNQEKIRVRNYFHSRFQ